MGIRTLFVIAHLFVVFGSVTPSTAESESPRKLAWEKYLDQLAFRFPASRRGLLNSIENFNSDSELQIACERSSKQRLHMTFSIVRDGRKIVSIEGHLDSVFRTFGHEFYFAQFWPNHPECVVVAMDAATGKQLWKSPELSGFGSFGASAYANQVTITLANDPGKQDTKDSDAIIITGRESFGDYITVIDRKTGAIIARKIYRKDFSKYD